MCDGAEAGYSQRDRRIEQLEERKVNIRRLSDQFRQTGVGGWTTITQGVKEMGEVVQNEIFRKIESYSDFTPDNDPYEEHDFGTVECTGHRIFWKIDCYDKSMTFHSPDASDPHVTIRVMTVMLAEEY